MEPETATPAISTPASIELPLIEPKKLGWYYENNNAEQASEGPIVES